MTALVREKHLEGPVVGTDTGQLTRLQLLLRLHETLLGNLLTSFKRLLLQDKWIHLCWSSPQHKARCIASAQYVCVN